MPIVMYTTPGGAVKVKAVLQDETMWLTQTGTQFRIWATQVLKEYVVKGFALDDDRLKKGGNPFGEDYFRELLERVRSFRASERRIWQQITDIHAECSTDYYRTA